MVTPHDLESLPEWNETWIPPAREVASTINRRKFLRGGLFAVAMATTMAGFDFLATNVPSFAQPANRSCTGPMYYATNCNGGARNSNPACDKGCVSEPQHTFYCIGTSYGSRHRTCGEERIHYDGVTRYSFMYRQGDCYSSNRDGWVWQLANSSCGCPSNTAKKASCKDGYYATRPENGPVHDWGPLMPSVCRTHSGCLAMSAN